MTRFIKRWICLFLALSAAVNIAVMPTWALDTLDQLPEEPITLSPETQPEDGETIAEPVQTEPEEAAEPDFPEEPEAEETIPGETEPEEEIQPMRNGFPLFLQTDYPDVLYGSGTMPTSGCSITCLAMVATYMTGHTYYPDELAGYFGGHMGSNIDRLEYASDMLQLPWARAENWHKALAALKEGKSVIVLMNNRSAFTEGQHFILATGLTEDGKVLINDPSSICLLYTSPSPRD